MKSIKNKILKLINEQASPKELDWLNNKASSDTKTITIAFVSAPRFISNTKIINTDSLSDFYSFKEFTLLQLVRSYLLLSLDSSDKDNYIKTINTLFDTAENNEAVSLIKTLSFLDFPEYWILRATNAVRSNVGDIFDAIAFNNPYPKQYFDQLAWNQMVLKCIFNDKPIHNIDGLDERTNQELANSISNLAHERWSAGRNIPAYSWYLVSNYVNENILEDIKNLFKSNDKNENIAAVLVCNNSDFETAKIELKKHNILHENIQNYSWENIV